MLRIAGADEGRGGAAGEQVLRLHDASLSGAGDTAQPGGELQHPRRQELRAQFAVLAANRLRAGARCVHTDQGEREAGSIQEVIGRLRLRARRIDGVSAKPQAAAEKSMQETPPAQAPTRNWLRWLVLVILVAGVFGFYALG